MNLSLTKCSSWWMVPSSSIKMTLNLVFLRLHTFLETKHCSTISRDMTLWRVTTRKSSSVQFREGSFNSWSGLWVHSTVCKRKRCLINIACSETWNPKNGWGWLKVWKLSKSKKDRSLNKKNWGPTLSFLPKAKSLVNIIWVRIRALHHATYKYTILAR